MWDIASIFRSGISTGKGVIVMSVSRVGFRGRAQCQTWRCACGSARHTRMESPFHVARSKAMVSSCFEGGVSFVEIGRCQRVDSCCSGTVSTANVPEWLRDMSAECEDRIFRGSGWRREIVWSRGREGWGCRLIVCR